MARITICDLCKERIKDDESKQGELTLSFYTNIELVPCGNSDCSGDSFCKPCLDQNIPKHQELVGELCNKCATLLRETIEGDDPLTKRQPAPIISAVSMTPTPKQSTSGGYAPLEKAIGPTLEEKATREPTKELLEDEMVKVPSRLDRKIANKAIKEMKGGTTCQHFFKTFRDSKVICSDAPGGIEGELAGFKGCGKVLTKAEY